MMRFKHIRSRINFPAVFVALSLLLAGCAGPDTSWERLRESGELRVGLDPTYPPFAVAAGDDLYGAEVDLAKALAAELGLEARFTYFGYDGLYDGLDTGLVDVLIAGLIVIPDRMEDFAYSDAYYDAGQVLVVRANDTDTEGMDDLAGRRLAVELGGPGHMEAGRWERRLRGLTVLTLDSPGAALESVTAGAADAALVDATSAGLVIRQGAPLQALTPVVVPEPFVMVVRIEDEAMLEQLNGALNQMRADGRLAAIFAEWLGR